jgi:hypothetical protein
VTLYVTPVFYTYLDDLQAWLARHTKRRPRAGRATLDHGLAHGD